MKRDEVGGREREGGRGGEWADEKCWTSRPMFAPRSRSKYLNPSDYSYSLSVFQLDFLLVRISFLGQGLTDDIILQFGLSSFFAEDDFSRLFTDHERWWIEEWRIVLARLIPSTFAAFHRNFSDRKEEREIPLNIIIIITIITYYISR